MRIILTLVAVALVVALSAALFAPFFVDWSLHRAQIEAELGDILGARVVVAGPIDMRFLPTPYLQLKNVTIADAGDDGAPVFACENVQLEAALASLPSGRARFTLARLEHPVLTLSRGSGGSLRFPQWRLKAQADRVALDRIVVTGGRLRIVDGGAPLDVAGLDLDAMAASLIGPYRGSGRIWTPEGLEAEFHFATAALANSALPLKLEIDPAAGLPSGVFDGALAFWRRAGDAGLDLAYSGAAAISGFSALKDSGPPSPWRVSGALHADLGGATVDDLILRFGPDERALEARGAARLEMGPTARLSADIKAKQLNVDALLREKGEDLVSPARALAALARVLSPLNARGGSPLALRIAFATPTVIVGAQTLADVAFDATAPAGAPIEGNLEFGLPGQSRLRLSGSLELGSAAGFKGRLEARLGDFAQLRDWATKDEPELAQRLSALGEALPYRKASAIGDVEASSGRVFRAQPPTRRRSHGVERRDGVHALARRRARPLVHGFAKRRARRRRVAQFERERRLARRYRSFACAGCGEVARRPRRRGRDRQRFAVAESDEDRRRSFARPPVRRWPWRSGGRGRAGRRGRRDDGSRCNSMPRNCAISRL